MKYHVTKVGLLLSKGRLSEMIIAIAIVMMLRMSKVKLRSLKFPSLTHIGTRTKYMYLISSPGKRISHSRHSVEFSTYGQF